jgi:hypothetical protein
VVVGTYLALGVLVAATRFSFPDKYGSAAAAQPAIVEPAAEQVIEQRELIAA